MSPHVLIGRYLDDLERLDRPPFYEAMVEQCITRMEGSRAISAEEFNYYCERFRRLAGRDVRKVE
ncbi:hypothetical protein [Pseudomonas typographi]|uniref:hypothetical protein n=1 Tax=Pseudomonas typographi TaxID=2715964 RepID=UPI0016845F42|nr:hypothetical protein [Pseudomonas typographi]MBD1554670.1 hypothetical protein [Pseudomonas typographi]